MAGRQPEQEAERAAGALRDDVGTAGVGLVDPPEDVTPHLRRHGVLGDRQRRAQAGLPRQPVQDVDVTAVAAGHEAHPLGGHDLEHAAAGGGHRCRDLQQLSVVGVRARHRAAVTSGVRRQPVRREADRAGAHRWHRRARPSRRDRRPWPGRRSRPRSPITNARSAPCGTWAATSSARGIVANASRYSGNVSHAHWMPTLSAEPGMSSTPSISWTSQSRSASRTGSEADPAVAEHGRRHPVCARRAQHVVPRRLSVVVGVGIDVTRRHDQPEGVDLAATPPVDATDLDDRAAGHRDVGDAERRARPVHHRASTDHHIEHRHPHETGSPASP